MSEKVLFELRVRHDPDGLRIEVTESPEWRDYHRAHPMPQIVHRVVRHIEDGFEHGTAHDAPPRSAPRANDLRRALDSLQTVYDDLYGSAATG